MRTLYEDTDIIIVIVKSIRLRWLGQVQRRGEHQLVKRVWAERPDEIKLLGRPRKQWIDHRIIGS